MATAEFNGMDALTHLGTGDSYYRPNCVANPGEIYTKLNAELTFLPRAALPISMYGRSMELPRDQQFYADMGADGTIPLHRYTGSHISPVLPWTPTLKVILDLVNTQGLQHSNHCGVNRYLDGTDNIGYHQDKTQDLEPGTGVVTISLGAVRPLYLQHPDTGQTQIIHLQPGSLFYLGPQTNAVWRHAIPKRSANKYPEPRISLTFRSIRTKYNSVTQTIVQE
jgi:alkylated DNA repair dioxygenase AlkB